MQLPLGAIEKLVAPVMSLELPRESYPSAENVTDPPAAMVALGGESTMWSRGPAVTARLAVAVFDASVPVTVCDPGTEAVQIVPLQLPSGAIEKTVEGLTLPSELPRASNPCAENANEPPAAMAALAGESTMWSRGPGVTARLAVAAIDPSVPVTT